MGDEVEGGRDDRAADTPASRPKPPRRLVYTARKKLGDVLHSATTRFPPLPDKPRFSLPPLPDREPEDPDPTSPVDAPASSPSADASAAARPDAPRAAAAPPVDPELAKAEKELDKKTLRSNPQKFGLPGKPFTQSNPLYWGFMATVGVLLAYFLLSSVGSLVSLFMWILASTFIALGLEPIVQRLERRRIKRPLAILIITVTAVTALTVFFSNLVPTIVDQVTQLVGNMPGYVDSILKSNWFYQLDDEFGIHTKFQETAQQVISDMGRSAGNIATGVVGAGLAISNGLFGALIIFVMTLYLLASMPAFKAFLYRLVPATRRHRFELLSEEIIQGVGGYVVGQAIVALCNALYAFVVLNLLGIPYPLLLASVVAVFAFIPLVGAFIALCMMALIAITISWQVTVGIVVAYGIYLQVEAYLIYPKVMNKAVAIPGGVSIVAVIAGGTLMGILGALIAIPVAAALMLLLREVVVPRQDRS